MIKDCGPEGVGMLSFPRPGISIALDIAVRKDTPALIDALNECVMKEGGRIYLAKDAFTRAEHFRAMDPRIDEFQRVRRIWDPEPEAAQRAVGAAARGPAVRKVVVLGRDEGDGAGARAAARRARATRCSCSGRDAEDLAASARDIEMRAGARAKDRSARRACDLERPDGFRGRRSTRRTRRWAASTPWS